MRNHRLISTTIAAAALAITVGGCSQEMAAPERQTTTGEQARMEETTVAGCLKAGMDENTYVLIAEGRTGAETASATYQLTNANNVNLQQHVNQQVRVTGTLRSQQEFASTGRSVDEDRAKGTTGTPVIETKTEVDVKRIAVNSVQPSGEKCAE
jgi:hypothetical protein